MTPPMINRYAPAPYAERLVRLAVGVEVRDATVGGRAAAPTIAVTVDEHPRPLHRWRRWAPGDRLDDLLPALTRHGNGRFSRLLERSTATTLRVRISDPSRRYVPRRFLVDVPGEDEIVAAEDDPDLPEIGGARRIFRPQLFAGAVGETRGTVIRGRVLTGEGVPLRWFRLQAVEVGADAPTLGWAHGDDRGEFVLRIANPPGQIGFPVSPLPVTLTVGFAAPAPRPPDDDPLTATVDPLWDLVEEPVVLPVLPNPANGDGAGTVADGRLFPAGFATHPFPTVDLELGRVRSLDLTLP